MYGISVFAPYGGYPVLCPCDPIAVPIPDTVNIFGLEHTSLGMACLETVGDTLKVTRLGSSGEDGVRVDLRNQNTSWSCSIGALTGSTGAGASLQVATYAIVDGVADQPIGTIRETIVGANETKLSVDYKSETYTVAVCNVGEEVLYLMGVEADYLLDGPNLLWPQERWCPWPFCSKIERVQHRWHTPHRRCPGWKTSGDLPPGFSTVIQLDSTSESAVLNWAALGIHDIPFTRIEIIPEDLADDVGRFSSAVMTIQGVDSVCITSESASLYCCPEVGMGNVDGSSDGLVTMGDLTILIDHLFITLTPLECPEAGNIDLSADGLITMSDLTVMIDNLFITLTPLPPCP